MKASFTMLISWVLLMACHEERMHEAHLPVPRFNLHTDLLEFRQKMTDMDTMKIEIDRSVCTVSAGERLVISKKSDSIKVVAFYREDTSDENWDWYKVYEKSISGKDTSWKFEDFLKRNANRITDNRSRPKILITSNGDSICYDTEGLLETLHFLADYSQTMIRVYTENENGMYGVEIPEEFL